MQMGRARFRSSLSRIPLYSVDKDITLSTAIQRVGSAGR